MKRFDCADNEIDLQASVEGAPLIPCQKPSAFLDMIVCLRVEGLGLSPEIREGVRVGVVFWFFLVVRAVLRADVSLGAIPINESLPPSSLSLLLPSPSLPKLSLLSPLPLSLSPLSFSLSPSLPFPSPLSPSPSPSLLSLSPSPLPSPLPPPLPPLPDTVCPVFQIL